MYVIKLFSIYLSKTNSDPKLFNSNYELPT